MTTLTYTEFKAYVTETLWRTGDSVFEADLTQIIRDAEARMSRDLRIEDTLTIFSSTITENFIALPADYAEIKSVDFPPKGAAAYITQQQYNGRLKFYESDSQSPPFYTIFSKKLFVLGSIGTENPLDISLLYYTKIPPFEDNTVDNQFYSDYSDMYLAAVLRQSYIHLRDHVAGGIYEKQYADLATSVMTSEATRKRSGGPLHVQLPGIVAMMEWR